MRRWGKITCSRQVCSSISPWLSEVITPFPPPFHRSIHCENYITCIGAVATRARPLQIHSGSRSISMKARMLRIVIQFLVARTCEGNRCDSFLAGLLCVCELVLLLLLSWLCGLVGSLKQTPGTEAKHYPTTPHRTPHLQHLHPVCQVRPAAQPLKENSCVVPATHMCYCWSGTMVFTVLRRRQNATDGYVCPNNHDARYLLGNSLPFLGVVSPPKTTNPTPPHPPKESGCFFFSRPTSRPGMHGAGQLFDLYRGCF